MEFHAIAAKTMKPWNCTGTELCACIAFHVTLTSIDSYHCDSHCLAWLLENLPAPPKHYGVFDVLLIRKVFAKAKNLGSHQANTSDDRFALQSKQILAKFSQVWPIPKCNVNFIRITWSIKIFTRFVNDSVYTFKSTESMNWMDNQCTFTTDPLNITFCLSGATPDKAKSCALNSSGDSSLSNSTFSNFSRPHFTDTTLRSKQTTDYIHYTNFKSGWDRL